MKKQCLIVLVTVATAFLGVGSLTPVLGQGIPLEVKQTGYCSVFAPRDWTFVSNAQASTAEANSADHTMYAGWGVAGINRAMQRYYGNFYGDPETSILTMVTQLVTSMGDPSRVGYTSAPQLFLNYFTLRRLESAQHAGLVFYRVYPGSSPQEYVESVYFALAHKSRGWEGVNIAAGVAVSLRCVTQLVPVPYAPPRSGTGKRPSRAGCGRGGNLRGYQKELGTQYAHSPSTGANFLFYATEWKENGPEGAGYYRTVGNSYEKLELGRDDDC